MIDKIIALSTYILAVSLATERLVALIKSLIPPLAKEPLLESGLIDEKKERRRMIVLQILAAACSFLTAWLLEDQVGEFCLPPNNEKCYSFLIVGALACGGSAFWTNILGYANAVKDIKKQKRAEQRMQLAAKAKAAHVPPAQMSAL